MCVSPITIPNKNRFVDLKRNWDKSVRFPWKDYTAAAIEVPCGHCWQCIRQKQDNMVQRVQLESLKNHFFMCTLTYKPEFLPVHEVNGYFIRYADSHDVQNMMKMLRKYNAFGIPFRYLAVSELGSKRGRPHFHILFAFPKLYFPERKEDYIPACEAFASKAQHYFTVLRYWRKNLGSRRLPEWHNLTEYVEKYVNGHLRKNYDFHYVNPFLTKNGIEDCGYYVLKYMFKPSDRATRLQQALKLNLAPPGCDDAALTLYQKEWNIVRPRYFASVGFGLNAKVDQRLHIFEPDMELFNNVKRCIDYSRENLDYPAFFNPFTGKQSLVSEYYLKRPELYSYDDRLYFWNAKSDKKLDAIPGDLKIHDIRTISDIKRNNSRYEKTVKHCDDLGLDSDLDLLD